jgi:hypothetical protein
MSRKRRLHLYEELMLLALRDKEGTFAHDDMSFLYALGGGLLAELLLMEKVSLEEGKRSKKYVELRNASPLGDPLLDECLERLRGAKRRATVETWVTRFGGLKKLRPRAAEQLCRRGILRVDEKSVLLVFSKKIYPELDPGPEREVLARLRNAIFSDEAELDSWTTVLVALADKAGVLKNSFHKTELKARKKRIQEIGEGDLTAAAVKEIVAGIQVAVMVAVMAATSASAAT